VHTTDSSVTYLNPEHSIRAFYHPHPGKIRTGDSGYIKDNELFIIGKAHEVFINNDSLVEFEQIIKIATSQDFVGNAQLYKVKNKLVLIVDINREYLSKAKVTHEELMCKCNNLKHVINGKVNVLSKLHAVVLFPDFDGLKTKEYKLVSLVSRQT
jgi:acyl-CoA synthetase (AMP-forming)/AMP-acid ligase II